MDKRALLFLSSILCVTYVQTMKKSSSCTEQDLKKVWSVGKYHIKIVNLPLWYVGIPYGIKYNTRIDTISLITTVNTTKACIIPLKESLTPHYETILASVRPTQSKIKPTVVTTILNTPSPKGTVKKFDYIPKDNSFKDCCCNGKVFAGWCTRFTNEYNMFFRCHDYIGLYDVENGMHFQYILLPEKVCSNGKSLVFNKEGTVLAVFLANNKIAIITPDKGSTRARGFEDVIVRCQH